MTWTEDLYFSSFLSLEGVLYYYFTFFCRQQLLSSIHLFWRLVLLNLVPTPLPCSPLATFGSRDAILKKVFVNLWLSHQHVLVIAWHWILRPGPPLANVVQNAKKNLKALSKQGYPPQISNLKLLYWWMINFHKEIIIHKYLEVAKIFVYSLYVW